MATKTFDKAKKNKADEFYTQLPDIEEELRRYKEQFRGKVVLCNCDAPYESNFFKYFALLFRVLELKKLIATCYIGSPIANSQLSLFDNETSENKTTRAPHKIVINEAIDENNDGAYNLQDIVLTLAKNKNNTLTRLNGDGDFRSQECIELLKEADIVVTNPPFSLFREYVAQLMEYDKKFLIIGSQNAIPYKDIFQFILENRVWLGINNGGTKWFKVPEHYDIQTESRIKFDENGNKYFSMGNVMWFTNLDHKKRHEYIPLYKKYSSQEYPRYDNYDAIEVSRVENIPIDWDGAMGVPITFLDKYNPEQFKILGIDRYIDGNKTPNKRMQINGKELYARIIIVRQKDAKQ